MATVTGYTAERMKEIEDSAVVDGNIVGDELILVRKDGVQINAGNVRGPQGPTGTSGDTSIQIVTSTTRPSLPWTGAFIYETDTNLVYSWNGTDWVYRGGIILCTSVTRPSSPFVGLSIYETDTKRPYTWDGTAWIYKGGTVICTSSTRPSSTFVGLSIYETDTKRPYTWDGTIWRFDGGTFICTSTTRPTTNLFIGFSIFEEDTKKFYVYDGTNWTLPKNVAGGALGYAWSTSPSTNIPPSGVDLPSLSLTLLIPASRFIEVSAQVILQIQAGTGATIAQATINEGSTELQGIGQSSSLVALCRGSILLTPTAGIHTYKVRAYGDAGFITSGGVPTRQANLLVEDLGGY